MLYFYVNMKLTKIDINKINRLISIENGTYFIPQHKVHKNKSKYNKKIKHKKLKYE